MEKIKKLIKFFSNKYVLFLLIVVILSYGQLVGMYVWQDDNALFFKLANLEGRAGYLGAGILGSGAYKYTATPYIPIYILFGFNTVPYFIFTLFVYFITCVVIYKLISKSFGEPVGKITSFIYASGYIASDGYIRLFNSVITSVSIMCISFIVFAYTKYIKYRKIKWYLISVLFFFLAIELARARTHYLISIILLFECIYIYTNKSVKNLIFTLLRLLPFVYIFNEYFVKNADHRSGQVKTFIDALLKGEFYQIYGFLSSLSNTLLPDWTTKIFINKAGNYLVWLSALVISIIVLNKILISYKYRKIIFSFVLISWFLIARKLFIHPLLNIQFNTLFIPYMGGISAILMLSIILSKIKNKKFILLAILWIIINIAAYSAYNPTVVYESVNRYLSHSLFAFSLLLGLIYVSTKNKKLILLLIIFLGVGNITNSIIYQNRIITYRSNPPRAFYTQLKEFVPIAKKGDIFYFDVADNARTYFLDSFSVAQMPETTAIAWRYGLDRYDIKLFTDYNNLAEEIVKSKVAKENIHSFWYSKDGLVDTSTFIIDRTGKDSDLLALDIDKSFDSEISINLSDNFSSVTPIELNIYAKAKIIDNYVKKISSSKNINQNGYWGNKDNRDLALRYKKFTEEIFPTFTYSSSSDWQDRRVNNIHDQDIESVWQSDRVKWNAIKDSHVIIDMKKIYDVDRVVWFNAYANFTPISYSVSASIDGTKWQKVAEVNNPLGRIEPGKIQITRFKNIETRYLKFNIYKTLNNDSPALTELWPVLTEFKNLDLENLNEYISNPFEYVDDYDDVIATLQKLNYKGKMKIKWKNNNSDLIHSNSKVFTNIIFDGKERVYKIIINPGGTKLTNIIFTNEQIPGEIHISKITAINRKIDEIIPKN